MTNRIIFLIFISFTAMGCQSKSVRKETVVGLEKTNIELPKRNRPQVYFEKLIALKSSGAISKETYYTELFDVVRIYDRSKESVRNSWKKSFCQMDPGADLSMEQIPVDVWSTPSSIELLGCMRPKDPIIHREIARILFQGEEPLKQSAAFALSEIQSADADVLQIVASVLEQSLIDNDMGQNSPRLKYSIDLVHSLKGLSDPQTEVENSLLASLEERSNQDFQNATFETLSRWNKISVDSQLKLFQWSMDESWDEGSREKMHQFLKGLSDPSLQLVNSALKVFQEHENFNRREEALSLLVEWHPTDHDVVKKLSDAGVLLDDRAPASVPEPASAAAPMPEEATTAVPESSSSL